jgi:hypothetical protein
MKRRLFVGGIVSGVCSLFGRLAKGSATQPIDSIAAASKCERLPSGEWLHTNEYAEIAPPEAPIPGIRFVRRTSAMYRRSLVQHAMNFCKDRSVHVREFTLTGTATGVSLQVFYTVEKDPARCAETLLETLLNDGNSKVVFTHGKMRLLSESNTPVYDDRGALIAHECCLLFSDGE